MTCRSRLFPINFPNFRSRRAEFRTVRSVHSSLLAVCRSSSSRRRGGWSPVTVFQLYRLHVKQQYDQLATCEPSEWNGATSSEKQEIVSGPWKKLPVLDAAFNVTFWHIFYNNRMCLPTRGDAFGTPQNGLAQRLKLYESFVLASHVYVG